MAILFSVLGVALAAFCVWLTVRIVNRGERWAKRTAAGFVIAMALYFLGAGALLWLNGRGMLPAGQWKWPNGCIGQSTGFT